MTEYRITKYDPANRINGVYMADEWTSFSDIGKVFNGTLLSQDTYLKGVSGICCPKTKECLRFRPEVSDCSAKFKKMTAHLTETYKLTTCNV